jgi:hypothetical protein
MSRFKKFVIFAFNRDFDQIVFAHSDFFTSAVYYNTPSEAMADIKEMLEEVSEERGTEITVLWDVALPKGVARNPEIPKRVVAFQLVNAKSQRPVPLRPHDPPRQMYALVQLMDNKVW